MRMVTWSTKQKCTNDLSPLGQAEALSQEERNKHSNPPEDWVKRRIIKGDLPSSFRTIPYSDSLFFVYDTKKHKYVLKDSTMHIYNLVHNVERSNEYYLFDESLKDTLEIYLKECAKQ